MGDDVSATLHRPRHTHSVRSLPCSRLGGRHGYIWQVRQPSMSSFDARKYTGKWYEHGFHDWTQFSDVYDTTLEIELSKDGSRWLDDFALRGPSPKAAPLSWDKSPVANGAHYFLYGNLAGQTPGVLQARHHADAQAACAHAARATIGLFIPFSTSHMCLPRQESGFGVTFPNYIVDIQKDEDGEYKEAIQFQCLEV